MGVRIFVIVIGFSLNVALDMFSDASESHASVAT